MASRTLAPTAAPTMTDARLRLAVQRADAVLVGRGTTVDAPELARALLYLYARLQSEDVLVVGDVCRFSVLLLSENYDMPGHESVPVRFVGGTVEPDGTRLLLLTDARPKAATA